MFTMLWTLASFTMLGWTHAHRFEPTAVCKTMARGVVPRVNAVREARSTPIGFALAAAMASFAVSIPPIPIWFTTKARAET